MRDAMKECKRIIREAWEDDPKEFWGECAAALAVMLFPVLALISALLIGGK